jgi:hypothetical protein
LQIKSKSRTKEIAMRKPFDDRFTRIGSRPVSLEDRLARIARLRRLTLEKSAADLLAAQMPEHLTTALDQPAR